MPDSLKQQMIIAVVCNELGSVCVFTEAASVEIMKKTEQTWEELHHIPFSLQQDTSMLDFRHHIQMLAERIKEYSKIIVGQDISGIAYHILNKNNLLIFEVDHVDAAVLDGVMTDIQAYEEDTLRETEDLPPYPVSKENDGIYMLDMIQVQLRYPELSTKKVLVPFFQETPFLQLLMVCSHVPAWLTESVYYGRYIIQTKKQGVNILVSIEPKGCNVKGDDTNGYSL